MTRAYDSRDADRLIPLLRSVQREIRERADSIRSLRIRMADLARQRNGKRQDIRELTRLQAELANHKREMRLAMKELERLGCAIDEQRPERVLIPGADGELTTGYAWSFGEGHVVAAGEQSAPDRWEPNGQAA